MNGYLIVLEGIDASGKATQAAELKRRLEALAFTVTIISFPNYENTIGGMMIKRYLAGEYGQLQNVHPELAALPYAIDRFQSLQLLQKELATHDVVICDRYFLSNLAHQGVRIPRDGFDKFCDEMIALECGLFGALKPDLTILLDCPATLSAARIARRKAEQQNRAVNTADDIHESQFEYMADVRKAYHYLFSTFLPGANKKIISAGDCVDIARPVKDIADDIFRFAIKAISVPRRKTFDGERVARAIFESWNDDDWDKVTESDRNDARAEAAAAIAEIQRQLCES